MTTERRYPVGVQTFSEIINGGYVYVDKTELMWQMTKLSKYIFLSRPRRFGKSLLSSTMKDFFEGHKELFKDLKVMELEQEWVQYPVLHFDLSGAKHMDAPNVRQELERLLKPYEARYGRDEVETTPGMRLAGLIHRACQQTGRQTVVIIDEYDAPLLDVLHDDTRLHDIREAMQEFFQRLKMCDPDIKFCFITGITKFSQLSIFSTINNLNNITMLPQFAAVCGITQEELITILAEDIRLLAEANGCSPEAMHTLLKQQYDGYHFAEDSPGVFNPFSLMKAFLNKKIQNYWFESGTPTFIIRQMQHFRTDITAMEGMEEPADSFDVPTEAMTTALPLLYQSGYLTIKGYDREAQTYTLAIPNQEVRIGYAKGLLPTYIGIESANVQTGFALKFWRALKKDDLNLALQEMQAYLASIPYVEGFKKKLEEAATMEGFYEYTFYLVFSMLNVYTRTQVKCAGGRIDIIVLMPNTTYVLELKVNGTAQQALDQINEKGYALPYLTEGRQVVKAGIHFNNITRTIDEWVVEC